MTKLDKLFEKILGLIVLLGASMLTVPIAIMLFTSENNPVFVGADRIMPIFAVASTFFGCFIQAAFSKITGKKASRDGFSDVGDSVIQGFHIKYAVVPLLLFITLAAMMYLPADAYFENLYLSDQMGYYNPIYGLFISALFLLSATVGCVIWFYPIERLTSATILVGAGVLFYAEMFFATLIATPLFSMGLSVLNHPNVTTTIGIPFIIFNICMLIVFNQNNLQQKFRGSVVSVITPGARMYNLFIVFMILLILALMCLLVYVVISAVYIILYAIVFVITYRLFYGKQNEYSDYPHPEYYGSEEAGEVFQRNVMSPDNQYLLAIFFLLLFTGAILFVLARTGYLKRIIESVRAWFRELISSFLIGRDIFKHSFDPNLSDEIYNYKDEKKNLQNAAIQDYSDMAANTDTYKLFMLRLSRMKNYDEQLCYAYAVLLNMYKKININLKTSDTPRQVEDKVRRSLTAEKIQKITNDFEKIRYAEIEVSDAEASAILTNICDEVKRYMY